MLWLYRFIPRVSFTSEDATSQCKQNIWYMYPGINKMCQERSSVGSEGMTGRPGFCRYPSRAATVQRHGKKTKITEERDKSCWPYN